MSSKVQLLILVFFLAACTTSSEENEKSSQVERGLEQDQPTKASKKTILFFGNSITAGYQLDMDVAFPALIQRKVDSLGLNYTCVNAGLSGETSAGGMGRINWVLRTVPDIFVLELGANDGLRGLSLEETPKNLQAIIDEVTKANPEVKVIIAGMMVPPNLGKDYTEQFQSVFKDLAESNEATLIPFLLEGVAGKPALNLSDGIHPTAEGHAIVAETVWSYLKDLL